ncbi:MAG TPA: hypothetical protein VG146_20230 [Verrucomicrobiae bacterium]|nr:hypothetical protein [Verrucomicrobiae bacterium]
MKHPIISRGEALGILKNDLRKAALTKHAAELANATQEERQQILKRIDRSVQKELWRRMEFHTLIH